MVRAQTVLAQMVRAQMVRELTVRAPKEPLLELVQETPEVMAAPVPVKPSDLALSCGCPVTLPVAKSSHCSAEDLKWATMLQARSIRVYQMWKAESAVSGVQAGESDEVCSVASTTLCSI